MKVYIDHLNLNLLSNIFKKLTSYHSHTEKYLQIYSTDGVYIVDQNSTNKLKQVDHDICIIEDFYEDLTIIIDPSFYIIEKSTHIPNEHISTMVKRDIFLLSKTNDTNDRKEKKDIKDTNDTKERKNTIKLVIESEVSEQVERGFDFLNNNINNGFTFKDLYIECPNGTDINDALVKKEIIVFLSLLN